MKPFLNCVLVVEGKSDAAYISSLYEVEIVTTNGYVCDPLELDYLKAISNKKQVVVLTDPDEAGLTIKNTVLKTIPTAKVVSVNKECCDKGGKHGVAECKTEEIKRVLDVFQDKTQAKTTDYLLESYILNELKNNQKESVAKHFHLGVYTSNKRLINRANNLNITKEEIESFLNKHGN